MQSQIRAITLDLDDTIWPFASSLMRAEAALDEWLLEHAPRAAERWPLHERERLRERARVMQAHIAHDVTAVRLWMFEHMLKEAGEDPALAGSAFDAYFAGRCDVEHYPDSVAALKRLAARVPLAAVTNGNACLRRIGLDHLFEFRITPGDHGAAKPDPSIFHAACARLGVSPADVLHVGDDPEMDVIGAARAGLRSCWLNRSAGDGEYRPWSHDEVAPDLEFSTLTALANWLDDPVGFSARQGYQA